MSLDSSNAKRKTELEAARWAIEATARRVGKSVAEVRAEMTEAMLVGRSNPDPRVQAMWKQIPCAGEMPTPEELIVWMKQHTAFT